MVGSNAVLSLALHDAGLATSSAQAQQEIKLGHVGEPGSLFDRLAQEFADRSNATARVAGQGDALWGKPARQRCGSDDSGSGSAASISRLPSTVMSSHLPLSSVCSRCRTW